MRICLLTFSFLFTGHAYAQVMKGQVTDAATGGMITTGNVIDLNSSETVGINVYGLYTINAREGDTLVFYAPDYEVLKRQATQLKGENVLNITLKQLTYKLNEVIIKGDRRYSQRQLDSIETTVIYKLPLQQTHPNPVMNPASAIAEQFSKSAKRVYKFQKIYARTETGKFIDSRYSMDVVASATNLQGDTAANFIYQYPMRLDFAQTATDLEIKMWIRTNYKDWLAKGKPVEMIKH